MTAWVIASIFSALLLGFYDIAKKDAVRKNGVLEVLLFATGISTLFFLPFMLSSLFGWTWDDGMMLKMERGPLDLHLKLIIKAVLVTASWVSGIVALKHLPLTTVGIVKASRPIFVLLGCLLIFGERLNLLQWAGVIVAMLALYLLSRTSQKEGISFRADRWVWCLFSSVLFGVLSALYDKYLMRGVSPAFMQGWCDLYITILLALTTVITRWLLRYNGDEPVKIRFDWSILLIAVFITVSDYLYFYSLSCTDSLLAVISMIRRSSVVVTFVGGAIVFHEGHIKSKSLALILLLTGMSLLLLGS